MKNKTRRPNDQRSDVKNPNNTDFKADRDNRSAQMNPQTGPRPGDAVQKGGGQ